VTANSNITRINIDKDSRKEFYFIGIASFEQDYKLSHLLNRRLNINLSHSNDEIITDNNNKPTLFSKFTTPDGNFTLISNRSDNILLIKKMNKIDFFYLANQISPVDFNNTLDLIRKIEGVTAAFIFKSSEIKDKNLEILQYLSE